MVKIKTLIKRGVTFIFHCGILLLGGIVRVKSIKAPKSLMLFNRLIIVAYVIYKLHFYITYE